MILFSKLHPGVWHGADCSTEEETQAAASQHHEMLTSCLAATSQALLISSSQVVPRSTREVRGINGFDEFEAGEESTVNIMFLTEFYRNAPPQCLDGYASNQVRVVIYIYIYILCVCV